MFESIKYTHGSTTYDTTTGAWCGDTTRQAASSSVLRELLAKARREVSVNLFPVSVCLSVCLSVCRVCLPHEKASSSSSCILGIGRDVDRQTGRQAGSYVNEEEEKSKKDFFIIEAVWLL